MATLRIAFLLIPGLLLLSSCRSEAPILVETATATPISLARASATPAAEALLEPPPPAPPDEQQLPSATATPSLTPTTIPADSLVPWSGYPAPTTTPATAVPPPVTSINLPPELEVMLLLGSDTTDLRRGRTDSIHLVFIHRLNGNASLVSIPRDLYVYQPGLTMDRINTAYLWGGFDLLALTIEYNFGVRPTRWVLVHLDDFVRFIDDLGGIDVPVSDAFPEDCGGIPSGVVHMDGGVALCYVRERNTTSDVARSRRQQEVLAVILQRVLSLDSLRHLPEWYERYHGSVQSNLGLGDLIDLIPVVLKMPEAGIHNFQIGWDQVSFWQTPENQASVLLPKRENMLPVIQTSINVLLPPPPTSPLLETRIVELTATVTPINSLELP